MLQKFNINFIFAKNGKKVSNFFPQQKKFSFFVANVILNSISFVYPMY